MEPKIRLLDRMRNVMRLKHMSLRTEQAHVSWVKRFILFHDKCHPAEMGADEIRAFLTHLAVHGQVAASTQNGTLNTLVFLYRQVLKQPFPELRAPSRTTWLGGKLKAADRSHKTPGSSTRFRVGNPDASSRLSHAVPTGH